MTTNKTHDKIDKVKEWGFDIRLDVNLDELMYYMTWCDGQQFRKDMFHDKGFVQSYMDEKFAQFRDDFQHFMWSMDGSNRQRFARAVKRFYNNKEKTDE